MSVDEIEKLLESYYEGRTSESEEILLRTYFATHEVPVHLQSDKEFFTALGPTMPVEVSSTLEIRLSRAIDNRANQGKLRHLLPRNRWRIGIAAGLVLLIGFGYTFHHYNHAAPQDTFNDPLEARQALQAALIEVSNGLNNGIYQITEVHQDIQEINQNIKQEIN